MAIVRCVLKSSSKAKIGKAERMEGTRIACPSDGLLDAEGANDTHYFGSQYFEHFTRDCNEQPPCQEVHG
jgi:hypothetical protein